MDSGLRGKNDPGKWGASLANLTEILFPLLDAVQPRTIAEIGAYEGDLTRELLGWAGGRARVAAIEPMPQQELVELASSRPELELVQDTSHDALRRIEVPDAVIIDGDHNYFTVAEELRLLDEKASWSRGPLVILHDVCWPHGRRDIYYVPEQIPEEHREQMVPGAELVPEDPGLISGGLPYPWAARHEGGPRNGVLTAVEDFVEGREGMRLAIIPAFFGLGVLWNERAPWSAAVAEILDPWDRNPILARLEANRVFHLAEEHRRYAELISMRERNAIQEGLFRIMLNSRAFTVGEWASRLRKGGEPAFSREHVRRALGEVDGDTDSS